MLEEVEEYRIDALDQANKLAIVMSVNNQFFDAFSYDQHWPRSAEEEKIYSIAWRLLATKQLVDKPSFDLRYALASVSWTKPISFLATCFAKSVLTPTDIPQRIALALTYKTQEDWTILFLFGRRTTSDAEVVHCRELAPNKIRSWKAKVTEHSMTNCILKKRGHRGGQVAHWAQGVNQSAQLQLTEHVS
ncbi:hypothetical protein TSTA_031120 [Talaromyces stipitatus ATCC 10500]|uniref:Uncharacterized protein n=1 Tax=Talaromyces stipitatus (strain ATCC 10500 / CBS 375.48 / QM 6759 / NRRL 1006) TaxID=441959 RepID=B8M7X0_TALSN|nr:uncharacterized protein TSTA_031120 [Talaromyces stipitatus ATCC 10500]EED19849.1 hypothetical protein TSTA_031120 [Talaromyces stipitatus ATCC 10500]